MPEWTFVSSAVTTAGGAPYAIRLRAKSKHDAIHVIQGQAMDPREGVLRNENGHIVDLSDSDFCPTCSG